MTEAPTYFTENHAVSMTLRDYFAAKAMVGILSAWKFGLPPNELIAGSAYQYADAMLKAREA